MQVMGAFNPGATAFGGKTVLLLRVAEAAQSSADEWAIPYADPANAYQLIIERVERKAGDDPRIIHRNGRTLLTSLSHLRLAWSTDGINFTIEPNPALWPDEPDEVFGLEDARITEFEGRYWITYSAVSPNGVGVKLASTSDFKTFTRHGMILPPDNKDACLFPQRIGGRVALLHRPMVGILGQPSIWLGWGEGPTAFGGHRLLMAPNPANPAEGLKIGAGPPPILTPQGWLMCWHGCSAAQQYGQFLALLKTDDPAVVLSRATVPFLTPELPWEREGFFPDVVFSNGWVQQGRQAMVYYGAADQSVGAFMLDLKV